VARLPGKLIPSPDMVAPGFGTCECTDREFQAPPARSQESPVLPGNLAAAIPWPYEWFEYCRPTSVEPRGKRAGSNLSNKDQEGAFS